MTLAIMSALLDEQRGLLAQLTQAQRVRRAGRTFWCGQWAGQDVVLVLSKVGKVAAATTATATTAATTAAATTVVAAATTVVASKLNARPSLERFNTPAKLPWMSRMGAAAQCMALTLAK